MKHALKSFAAVTASALVIAACAHGIAPAGEGGVTASLTVNEAMLGVFQPEFQNYGDTAFWAYDDDGNLDGSLLTEEQWQQMGEGARAILEASRMFASADRFIVAGEGVELGFEGQGFVPPEHVQANIDGNPEGFAAMFEAIAGEAEQAVLAVDTRDAELLVAMSDSIYTACKGCHMAFWYPGRR